VTASAGLAGAFGAELDPQLARRAAEARTAKVSDRARVDLRPPPRNLKPVGFVDTAGQDTATVGAPPE
jgi:hypothetical protein